MNISLDKAVLEARNLWTHKGHPSGRLITQLAKDFEIEYLVAENLFFDSIAEYPEPEEGEV